MICFDPGIKHNDARPRSRISAFDHRPRMDDLAALIYHRRTRLVFFDACHLR